MKRLIIIFFLFLPLISYSQYFVGLGKNDSSIHRLAEEKSLEFIGRELIEGYNYSLNYTAIGDTSYLFCFMMNSEGLCIAQVSISPSELYNPSIETINKYLKPTGYNTWYNLRDKYRIKIELKDERTYIWLFKDLSN